MNDLALKNARPDGPPRRRLAVVASVTSILTVILLHGLPLLNLFFAVPLCVAFIAYGKRYLAISVISACALDTLVSVALSFLPGAGAGQQAASLVVQSALMILPVLALLLADRLRIRYCVSLAGILSAVCWLAAFFLTDIGSRLSVILRDASGVSAEMLYTMIPDGYDKVAFRSQINGDTLYAIMTKIFSCAFASFFVGLYAASYVVASRVAAIIGKRREITFDSRLFYVEYWVFIPLVAGMTGIIAGRLVASSALDPLFWNIFALAALFFVMQGFGIARFFLGLLRARTPLVVYFFVSVALIVFLIELWPVALAVLFIAGVLELFVPVRARFNNKDIADPTPGDGQ